MEAYKVDEWYQFLPAVTYKFLDAEQAEERFLQQDKVFNQFALKAQIQKQLAEQEEREQQDQLKAKTSGLVRIENYRCIFSIGKFWNFYHYRISRALFENHHLNIFLIFLLVN